MAFFHTQKIRACFNGGTRDDGGAVGGLYTGSIDGVLTSKTTKAFQRFLSMKGCNPGPEDGDFGADTVRALQGLLTKDGLNPGPIDSEFGRETTTALQTWLKSQGEDPGPIDGKLGSATIAGIQRFLQNNSVIGKPEVRVLNLFGCSGGSNGTFRKTNRTGFQGQCAVSRELQYEIKTKLSSPVGVFFGFCAQLGAAVGVQASSIFESSFSNEHEEEIIVNLDRPCYIYQLVATVTTRFGCVELRSAKIVTDKPQQFNQVLP